MKLKLLFFPLSIVIAIFFLVYFTKPAWDSYSLNKKDLERKIADLAKAKQNKSNLDKILSDYEAMSSGSKLLIHNSIPLGVSEEEFIYDVNFIIKATGIRLGEVVFSEKSQFDAKESESEKGNVNKTTISMSLSGNYFQLKKALYLIENMNRFVRVDNFAIESGEGSENLGLALTLTVFHREGQEMISADGDSYLNILLASGLNSELIDKYKKYRGEGSAFNFGNTSDFGKDNLFGVGDIGQIGIESEVEAEKESEEADQEGQESTEEESSSEAESGSAQ